MVDVFVRMPGSSAAEVENRVTRPMEKLLLGDPGSGVCLLHDVARQSNAIVPVQGGRGRGEEHRPPEPEDVAKFRPDPARRDSTLVKPPFIDDVPILAVTLSSARHDRSI